jgi:CRISPR type IV-associated protein Csf3
VSAHVPFRVTMHLAQGYSAADPWSPTLDGILAEQVLRERLGEEAFALGSAGTGELTMLGPGDLPLATDTHGEHWWWCASSPIIDDRGRFSRWLHRRFDDAEAAERVAEKVRAVNEKSGPYRAYRVRREVILTPTLTWHAIGDPDEARRLLSTVTHVGYGRAKGYGQIKDGADELPMIEVTPDGAREDLARTYRPLPLPAAQARGLNVVRLGGGVSRVPMRWGIRPPARLPEHQALCAMPVGLDR